MQTIIVEIYIPAISTSFDFRLPSTGRIDDVIWEVIRILETTQQNLLFDKERPILCDRDRSIVLNGAHTVEEAGLQDGAQLLLA